MSINIPLDKNLMDQLLNMTQDYIKIEKAVRIPLETFERMVGSVYKINQDQEVIIIGFDRQEHHFTVLHSWDEKRCEKYKVRDIIAYITNGSLRFVI